MLREIKAIMKQFDCEITFSLVEGSDELKVITSPKNDMAESRIIEALKKEEFGFSHGPYGS